MCYPEMQAKGHYVQQLQGTPPPPPASMQDTVDHKYTMTFRAIIKEIP